MASAGLPATPAEDNANAQTSAVTTEAPTSFSAPFSLPVISSSDDVPIPLMPKSEAGSTILENSFVSVADPRIAKEDAKKQEPEEIVTDIEEKIASDVPHSSVCQAEQDSIAQRSLSVSPIDEAYSPPSEETDELSPTISNKEVPEDSSVELPMLPSFVDLSEEQKRNVRTSAIQRVFDSYKILLGSDGNKMRLALLARLVAQVGLIFIWSIAY